MNKPDFNLPILLVDDDAMVRGVVEEYLASFGFTRIVSLGEPQRAIKLLQESKAAVGLIISDWEMPGVSGLTLLKAVRNNPLRCQTRFIMITSQRSMERFKVTQAAQWRVNSYLMKPFRAETLRTKIWTAMGWDEADEIAS